MKVIIILYIFSCVNSEFLAHTNSKCTKHLENEHVDGTLACLRETHGIYLPYFTVKAYVEAFHNDNCYKIKEIYKQYYKRDKGFRYCHQKWNVELIE